MSDETPAPSARQVHHHEQSMAAAAAAFEKLKELYANWRSECSEGILADMALLSFLKQMLDDSGLAMASILIHCIKSAADVKHVIFGAQVDPDTWEVLPFASANGGFATGGFSIESLQQLGMGALKVAGKCETLGLALANAKKHGVPFETVELLVREETSPVADDPAVYTKEGP